MRTQTGGGTMQTLTRTVGTTLFTGTNFLSVGCPTGYVATGSGFTVPAVVETQYYVASINPVTLTPSNAVRNVVPITVSQSTTGATTATVQVGQQQKFNATVFGTDQTDVTWKVTNTGNTTAAYAFRAKLKRSLPPGTRLQLVVRRVYTAPQSNLQNSCGPLLPVMQNQVVVNVAPPRA